MEIAPFDGRSRRSAMRGAWIALTLAAVASIPLLAPERFLHHPDRVSGPAASIVGIALAIAALVGGTRLLRFEPLPRRALLLAGCALAAVATAELHRVTVDESIFVGTGHDNTDWQRYLQDAALMRDGSAVPHAYRFLPMSTIALLEQATGSFDLARRLYRLVFSFVLVLWIVRLTRAFVPLPAALLVPAAYIALYPVTIRLYGGQPTDPLSHLSFVLAFAALAAGAYGPFFVALALGTLAKESVLALAGFYLLFHARRDAGAAWRVPLAGLGCLAALALPRLWVVDGASGYAAVSGVDPAHVLDNLAGWRNWMPAIGLSLGPLAAWAAWGWGDAPRLLRRLALFLAPVLLLSSLVFSWLHEARNYVPLMVLLALIGVCGLIEKSAENPA